MLFVAACSGEDAPPASGDAAIAGDASVDAPIDAVAEPMPAFTVAPSASGSLAIDEVGIRPTFQIGAQTYASYVALSLRETGATTSCAVWLTPSFVAFDGGSTGSRIFKTVRLNPAAATIIDDKCGWDDTYILQQLASIGMIEIGFSQARFAEDRPYLDLFFDGEEWLPSDTASIVYTGAADGWTMAADGTVNATVRVQPVAGTLDRGLYDF